MISNPYQPPSLKSEPGATSSRTQARHAIRIALVILLLPALYNYYAFDAQLIAGGRIPATVAAVYRAINLLGFIFVACLIWFLGLPLIERISRLIRLVCARTVNVEDWDQVLHYSLHSIVYFAIPGAILWVIWVVGFYQLEINFFALSWLIGVPAHLLAAGLYLPLLYRWYLLRYSLSPTPTAQNHPMHVSGGKRCN